MRGWLGDRVGRDAQGVTRWRQPAAISLSRHIPVPKSQGVYRRLRNFRAGIEAGISVFKRAYGGARCIWRGLDHFKAYIWSAVVAHNLMLFARLKSP